MKAVVLVGGEGTRLRPITETMPKPLVPLMDRPSLDHVLDHLARHGVHEVVLSSSYLETVFHAFIEARHGDDRPHARRGRAPVRSRPDRGRRTSHRVPREAHRVRPG